MCIGTLKLKTARRVKVASFPGSLLKKDGGGGGNEVRAKVPDNLNMFIYQVSDRRLSHTQTTEWVVG